MAERLVGMVTHYFPGPNVAVIKLVEGELSVGDHIHFVGHTTDFEEDVGSMEVEHQKISHADPGAEIGLQVLTRVRPHDKVFKVVPEGTAN
jgi:putative protease